MKKILDSNQLRETWFCHLVVSVLLALSCAAPVKANLIYSGAIFTEEDETGSFNSTNYHSLSMGLSQNFTNFLSANEIVRYSSQRSESLRSEQLVPSIDLVNENLLTRLNMSVSSSMALDKNEKLDDSARYEMGFKSKWKSDLVPALQVVINRKNNRGNPGLLRLDNVGRDSLSTTLDWERNALGLYYNHRLDEDFFQDGGRLFTIESHNGNLKFAKSYWDKKLQVSFSHGYTNIETVQEATATGSLISQPLLEVRSGIDNTPADPLEATAANALLRDGNLLDTAYSVASSSNFNNILLALSGQVDQIYLYTRTDLSATPLTGLTWTLFSNDILGTAWDAVTLPPGAIEYRGNVPEPYFVIKIDGFSANYLKLVLDIPLAGPAVDFTEVRAFDASIVAGSENISLNRSNNTSLSLGGRLSRNWSYNYRANLSVTEIGKTSSVWEQERQSQGGDLKYNSFDGTFFSVVGFSTFKNKSDRKQIVSETESVHYSVDIDKQFLPTLSAGIGWELNELSAASERLTETVLYRFESTAQIYPDLSLNLEVDASESESFQVLLKNSAISTKLALTSRLKPDLFLDVRKDSSAEGSGFGSLDRKINTSGIVFRWRPSDDLNVSGSASYRDSNTPEPNQILLNLDVGLAVAEGVLLEADYSTIIEGENDNQTGEVSLNWYPKRGFRIDGGCRYRHFTGQVGKDFMAYGRLYINFALPG